MDDGTGWEDMLGNSELTRPSAGKRALPGQGCGAPGASPAMPPARPGPPWTRAARLAGTPAAAGEFTPGDSLPQVRQLPVGLSTRARPRESALAAIAAVGLAQSDGGRSRAVVGAEILAVTRGQRDPLRGNGTRGEPALVTRYPAARGPMLRIAAGFAVTSRRAREVLAAHGADLDGAR